MFLHIELLFIHKLLAVPFSTNYEEKKAINCHIKISMANTVQRILYYFF